MSDSGLEMELMQLAFGDARAASPELINRLGRRYASGELLFREGDRGDELFIVLRGEVEIFSGPTGSTKQLAMIPAGQILGEMSHFDDHPRSASARARGPVDALALDRQNFGLIFQLHPKWTIQLVEGLAHRIDRTLQSLPASRA